MPEQERAQRVAIADDDVLLRQGLAALLREGGYDVIGQASDADGLIELVRKEQRDIAIVDIRMPPTHTTEGLEAARTIRAELPQVAILVLSAHIEVEHARSLWIAEGTVEKHVRNIFQKLQLPDAPDDHRRVLAVIAFLGLK